MEFVSEISDLLPTVVEEMNKLRNLNVDRSKSDDEQKKQAGFIQQRKRARLNELFKTLQNFGFSYRYGMTSCTDIKNYEEMYKYGEFNTNPMWVKSEKYFFRCFARFRHLVSLLDRPPPPDIGANLNDRFQGFVQHMMNIARSWRQDIIGCLKIMESVNLNYIQLKDNEDIDSSKSGKKYRALLTKVLDVLEPFSLILKERSVEFDDISNLKDISNVCETRKHLIVQVLNDTPENSVFPSGKHHVVIKDILQDITKINETVNHSREIKSKHPIAEEFKAMGDRLIDVAANLEMWCQESVLKNEPDSKEVLEVIY